MPEIEIGTDGHGRTEFKFNLIGDEDARALDHTNLLVSAVNTLVNSNRKSLEQFMADRYTNQAVKELSQILPADTAVEYVQSLLNNEIGKKVTLLMKGKTESEGFELQK